MQKNVITIDLPEWMEGELAKLPTHFPSREERLALVIEYSRLNVVHDTGGPFSAAVFERDSGKLVSLGVNRVVPTSVSCAHAEFTALSLAQQKLGTFDLSSDGLPAHELVVNWRPCAMCYGSVIWSGVRSLVIGGSGDVVEQITGFDEGPLVEDWIGELNRRGIEVADNQARAAAIEVFELFRDSNRLVYNARRSD